MREVVYPSGFLGTPTLRCGQHSQATIHVNSFTVPSGNFQVALKIARTNGTSHSCPNVSTAASVPRGYPILTRAASCGPSGAEEGPEVLTWVFWGRRSWGPPVGAPRLPAAAHRISLGARLCKEESQSHLEQGGGPEPEDAWSRARVGAAPQLPEGAWAQWGGRLHPGGVGGAGAGGPLPRLRDSRWLLARCHAVTASRPLGLYRHCPPPCLCAPPRVVPTLPLWFPLLAQSLCLASPRSPPSSPHPPSPGAACCLDSPGVASLRHLALQCNSGTHNQPVPLKPTAPLKSDHQV